MQDKLKRITVAVTITAVLFLFILISVVIYQLLSMSHKSNINGKLEQQIEAYERQSENLDDELLYRRSTWYIEKYAREKLGFIYPGEKKYEAVD